LAGLSKIITSRRDTGERCTFMQRLMQRIAYSFSAAVITNADALKQILVRKEFVPGRKIRRVYNTVDFTRFFPKEPPPQLAASLSLPAHAPVIGIVSSLRPEKDHKTFIRAAIEIRKVRPNGRFLIVGDGAMREELERFTREHDMADAVVFTGDRLDVPDVLALMDVCVLTSRNEGLSNAIIEAMACARPIVATDVGGTRELVADGQTGFLIQPQDHANLAERVLRILDDPALASKLGELARKKALENFSPDVFLPNVEALYASVLNQEQRFAGTCEREGGDAT